MQSMIPSNITAKVASSLATCIAAKEYLTKLNLSENELKDEGASVMSKVLEVGLDHVIEVDLSTNSIRRVGARLLAQAVVHKPGFKLLNINSNFICDEGIDEVKLIFKNSPSLLGSLDENHPEGEDLDETIEENGAGNDDILESQLKNLEIKQE